MSTNTRGEVTPAIGAAIKEVAGNIGRTIYAAESDADGAEFYRDIAARMSLFHEFVSYVSTSPRYRESDNKGGELFGALSDAITYARETGVAVIGDGGPSESSRLLVGVSVVLQHIRRIASVERVVLDQRTAFILAVGAVLSAGTYRGIELDTAVA